MSEGRLKVDWFLVGVPKSASTWIYHCFAEHPEIFVPDKDSLQFFDLKYHKGPVWYHQFFKNAGDARVVVDPSPTYFRSAVAPERIARDFPEAGFILSLRNPIDRAFSQFWHEKKNRRFDYAFDETVGNFLLYSWYIETGFYATHLKNFLRFFSLDRFTIVLFDDLKKSPENFIRPIFDRLGVDPSFRPSVLNTIINQAGVEQTSGIRVLRSNYRRIKRWLPWRLSRSARSAISNLLSNKDEYKKGIGEDLRQELRAIYRTEIDELETITGLDLSCWKE